MSSVASTHRVGTTTSHSARQSSHPMAVRLSITLDREDAREALATQRIAFGIATADNDRSSIDTTTARLIAATLHPGLTSHLERFAATGELDPQAAMRELEACPTSEPSHLMWAPSFSDFLQRLLLCEGATHA